VRVTTHGQTDTHTDRQTHRQTQTDFIICPMLYAIAMGQIKSVCVVNEMEKYFVCDSIVICRVLYQMSVIPKYDSYVLSRPALMEYFLW